MRLRSAPSCSTPLFVDVLYSHFRGLLHSGFERNRLVNLRGGLGVRVGEFRAVWRGRGRWVAAVGGG